MVLLLPSKSFDFICFKQCLPFSVSGVVKEKLKSWQTSGMSPPLAEVEFQDSPAVRSSSSGWWFQPYLGKWSNLTNIFQMSWNHQVVMIWSHDLMIHQCFLADVSGSRPSTRVPNSLGQEPSDQAPPQEGLHLWTGWWWKKWCTNMKMDGWYCDMKRRRSTSLIPMWVHSLRSHHFFHVTPFLYRTLSEFCRCDETSTLDQWFCSSRWRHVGVGNLLSVSSNSRTSDCWVVN